MFGYEPLVRRFAMPPARMLQRTYSVWGGKPWLTQYWVRRVNEQVHRAPPDRGYGGARRRPGQMGGVSALMSIGLTEYAGHGRCPPVYEITLAGLRRGVDPPRQALLPGRPFRPVRHPHLRQFGQELLYPTRTPQRRVLNNFWFPSRRFARGGLLDCWLGPKPNPTHRWERNSPNSGRHIPIGGASGQRMRRFQGVPPGRGRNNTEKPGATGRGRNSRKEREQCGCRNARNAR